MSLSNRATATVVVIVAFVAGILVGVAGDHIFIMHRGFPRFGQRAARGIVGHLERELKLTPQQKNAVAAIVERHRQRMDAIGSSIRPQMDQEIAKANAEIAQVLTPEQRVKFEQMRMRMHERRERRGLPPGR